MGSDAGDIPSPAPWDVMIFSGETLPMWPGFAESRTGDQLSRPLPKVGARGETRGERLGKMTVRYRNLIAPKPTRREATSGH